MAEWAREEAESVVYHNTSRQIQDNLGELGWLTHQQVKTCYADRAYNRSLEYEEDDQLGHVEMVISGIQGFHRALS